MFQFKPGKDDVHYCKPTSVAVTDDTQHFFVADGYCNSRIIKYSVRIDTDGKHIVQKEFQARTLFNDVARSSKTMSIAQIILLGCQRK